MADITREDLIEYGEDYLKDLTAACCKISEKHKAFVKTAIADMKRVEKLEAYFGDKTIAGEMTEAEHEAKESD